jgi:hypothetical protein
MNREGAEIYLRLLGESELRGPLVPEVRQSWSGGPGGGTARMIAVALALTAVGALDTETAEEILGDFDLAVGVRQAQTAQGSQGSRPGHPARIRRLGTRPLVQGLLRAWPARSMPGVAQPPGAAPAGAARSRAGATGGAQPPGGAGATGGAQPPGGAQATGGAAGSEEASAGGGDRFVAVGVTVPFDNGHLHLVSYTWTASGARFTAVWRMRDSYPALPGHHGMPPIERFSATDDRGGHYRLYITAHGGPAWTGNVGLQPNPPDDIRWIDISAPGGGETRVGLGPVDPPDPLNPLDPLHPAAPGSAAAEVRETKVSPGEHLLNLLAVRLLTIAPEFPHDLRLQLAAVSPGPLSYAAIGLGDVIAALEAADALPPLSPVPGRLAALCASLRVSGHGISAPPARDLPEPWLSMLAHYHRRKPDTAPARDGYATIAAGLPELDGIRVVLLGVDNSDGNTVLNVLVSGLAPDNPRGFSGSDTHFPLSIWVRDSGGRWHATRTSGWHWADGEYAISLHMVPPLAWSTHWIDVLAAGLSAEVRVRLPLDWGYSP